MFVCFSVCFTSCKRKGIRCVCSCVKIYCFWAATESCWSRRSFPHCSHLPLGSWAPAGSDIPAAMSAFPEMPLMQHPLPRISPARQGRKRGIGGAAQPATSARSETQPPARLSSSVLTFIPWCWTWALVTHGRHDPARHSIRIIAWPECKGTAGRRAGELQVPRGCFRQMEKLMTAHNVQSTQRESQLYILVCWSRLWEPALISYLMLGCSAVPAIRSLVRSLVHLYNPKVPAVIFDDLKGQRDTKPQCSKSPYILKKK